MSDLRAAFYGDDFTGSVDTLLQFARAGWTGRLFVGLPDAATLAAAASEVDVVGVAGIARSLPTAAIEDEVRPVFEALRALGPGVVQYKACSTADSSPVIGSLGRVLEVGRSVFGDTPVPLLFAQPDFGRYTAFGHHFAAEDGVVYRLDRQPTMSRHPSTPMTESDLAAHLSRQTYLPVGNVPYPEYADAAALAARISGADAAGVVLDATGPAHVDLVGAAVAALPGTVFAIGSGGLSYGLGRARPGSAALPPRAVPARGPVLAVSGSRSPRTRAQADAAAAAGWLVRPLPVPAVGGATAEVVAALADGRSVVLTSDDADLAAAGPRVLEAIAEAAASVVRAAVTAGAVHRVIVCGGDTSSRVTRLIGVGSLSIAANPEGNIVLCRAHAPGTPVDGLELLLKGGQVGTPDLFERTRTLGA